MALAAVALVTGCTAGDGSRASSEPVAPTPSPTHSPKSRTATPHTHVPTPASSPAPYLPVPKGVALTDPGSELELGERGTIAWRPQPAQVGVLAVTVRKLVRSDIKELKGWRLDSQARRSSLYFVTMTVANEGRTDLGGRRIPLYVLDDANALVESSAFKTEFQPCPSPALPEHFVAGKRVTVCQAYLVPEGGALKAVSFRPTPTFNPITWVGRVSSPRS